MNWIILGAGLSGKSLANYFYKNQEATYIYDNKPLDQKTKNFFLKRNIKNLSIKECENLLKTERTSLIISPGVNLSHPLVNYAKQNKRTVTNEIDFSLEKIQAKTIAITGTNGKSTVASMCYHILKEAKYHVALVGNIGTPISTLLTEKKQFDILVIELSSYQLEQLSCNNFLCSVFTNFAEDHLERHKNMTSYFSAKWKIFGSNNPNARGFYGKKIETTAKKLELYETSRIPLTKAFSSYYKKMIPDNILWPQHNIDNAMLAIRACKHVSNKKAKELGIALNSFKNIDHRFQIVAKKNNMLFINDSKATNIDATLSALCAMEGSVILLLGGLSKGSDFKPLYAYQHKIKKIVAFGQASKEISEAFSKTFSIEKFKTLKEVMSHLKKIIQKHKHSHILLSPACSSLDEFKNFSARGDYFSKEIKLLLKQRF